MPETLVIVNTSPLLYLYQVDCLELLQQLYGTMPKLAELNLGDK